MSRIIIQELFPEGVLTTFEDETQELLPYGPKRSVSLYPNNELTWRKNGSTSDVEILDIYRFRRALVCYIDSCY